jgi:hypothetical protein
MFLLEAMPQTSQRRSLGDQVSRRKAIGFPHGGRHSRIPRTCLVKRESAVEVFSGRKNLRPLARNAGKSVHRMSE